MYEIYQLYLFVCIYIYKLFYLLLSLYYLFNLILHLYNFFLVFIFLRVKKKIFNLRLLIHHIYIEYDYDFSTSQLCFTFENNFHHLLVLKLLNHFIYKFRY